MCKFPFQLSINCVFPKSSTESLVCTALLRSIPGRRKVYDALWAQKPVIVKLFSHKISAHRHLKTEWQGLRLLQKRQSNSPIPLFHGKTEDGCYAMVMEKITDSSTALQIFNQTKDQDEKLNLLVLIAKEMANQHSKGILQKDLHLGNFLVKGENIFSIDPTQMSFYPHKISRKKSLSQLASLALYFTDEQIDSISQLLQQYCLQRNWTLNPSQINQFYNNLPAHRQKTIKKGLKKTLRTNKRQLRLKNTGYTAVIDKGFFQDSEPAEFLKQLDILINTGQILKKGNTCWLVRAKWASKNLVIKRYNHKTLFHSLRHTIKKPRACRVWLHAHRLGMLNIATPKPIAYIEKHKGPIIWESYLVTDYIEAPNLYSFSRDDNITQQQKKEALTQVKSIIDKLAKYKITHGDMKLSNILLTETGPVLTDLDSMTIHKLSCLCKIQKKKDIARLNKDC